MKNIKTAKAPIKIDIESPIVLNTYLYRKKYMIRCISAIIQIILLLENFLSKRNLANIMSNNIWLKLSCDYL